MSIGESGFLEAAGWDEDAMRGWKQYFAKMSESENEDSSWQKTGKFPKLSMTADEFQMWCKSYLNSLIVKLMRKTFGVGFMRQRMERMWGHKPIRVTPLNNGYYIVFFQVKRIGILLCKKGHG